MVKVSIGKDNITLEFPGAETLMALKRRVKIPLKSIESVSTEPRRWLFPSVKVGVRVPGVIIAGTYWTPDGREFYYMRNPKKCVTVKLKGNTYKKVIFHSDNKEETAQKIRDAI